MSEHEPPSRSRAGKSRLERTLAAWVLLAATLGITPVALADPPRVEAVRTETPPTIDGLLDDGVWTSAGVIDQLTQIVPVEGATPTEATEVRILYDSDFIYFAIRCHDRDPDAIVATQMRRDASLGPDDRVALVIDPFFDQRNGFYFQTNPVGSRVDALVERNRSLRREWDGIWRAKCQIDDEGWTAEIAIPFKTLSFDPSTTTWGLNISRTIRRRNEEVRWAATTQNVSIADLRQAGRLTGIEGIRQGVGLDLVPYGAFRYREDQDTDESDVRWDTGGDVFYRITPFLTGALTINTDFAETEVDERQINLTRFPLFFPEKRDFFLQDAGIFSFGGIFRNPLPFQSRRIGISPNGEPRDIRVGSKLTGRTGGLNVGLLNVELDDQGDQGSDNVSVARLSYNVLEESTIGTIFTRGDPNSTRDNWVVGGDFLYRDSNVFEDKVLDGSLFILQSQTESMRGDDASFGFKFGYPNDRIRWQVGFTEIQENFNPALGFVPRPEIREYFGNWRYRWRPGGMLRRIDAGASSTVITDLDDEIQTRQIEVNPIEIEFESSDRFSTEVTFQREVLTDDFEIGEGVTIDVDDYRFERYAASFDSATQRPVSVNARFEVGTFFDGTRYDTRLGLEWRASKHLTTGIEFEQNDLDLDDGDFTTRIGRLRANIYFTPDISWTTFTQYDNFSDSVGINSRFRWIVDEGNDIFIVVNQEFEAGPDTLRNRSTEFITKVGWTFRF